jgi:septal ring factor EnvC (AmiA/AmiB activator)
MRLDIPLILLIIALIVLGGLAVDEHYVRDQYTALQAQNLQLQETLKASNDQVAQLTGQLNTQKAQMNDCKNQNASLSQTIVKLQAEINRLNSENNKTSATNSVNTQAIGISVASALGLVSFLGVRSVKHIHLVRKSSQNQPRIGSQTSYIRMSEQEIQNLIRSRRNK